MTLTPRANVIKLFMAENMNVCNELVFVLGKPHQFCPMFARKQIRPEPT
jgi:hypothetical protein